MGEKFKCRMVDYDGPDEWSEVDAFDSELAATTYAEWCDDRSGGELLREHSDRQIIEVKYKASAPIRYEIRIDYVKSYYADLVSATDRE